MDILNISMKLFCSGRIGCLLNLVKADGFSKPWGELGSSWDEGFGVRVPDRIIKFLLASAFIVAVFPASVSKLGGGCASTGVVVARASSKVALSEALVGLVAILLGSDLVVLE